MDRKYRSIWKRFIAVPALAFTVLTLSSGCFPVWSRQRAPLPTLPINLHGSQTRQPISEVLIVPLYVRSTGWSAFGPCPKHGGFLDRNFLANPFVYRLDEEFKFKQRGGLGFSFLFIAYAGCLTDARSVLVVAPGYQVLQTSDFIYHKSREFTLVPLEDGQTEEELRTVEAILQRKVLKEPELRELGIDTEFIDHVHNQLSWRERKLVRSFVEEGLPKLGEAPPLE